MRVPGRALFAAVLCASGVAVLPAQGLRGVRAVSFPAADGRTVTALQVDALQRPAPAVVFVPMLGRGKEDWLATADRFAAANITALAVDLPGTSLPADAEELPGWRTVVSGAVDYLFNRADVRAVGVAGASLGANLAALAAAGDSRVSSMALISPSLDYRGVRIESALAQYGGRPALLLASRGDPYAARSVRELALAGEGLREQHWSDTAAHGTVLLAREPDLTRVLVDWFLRTLR
jgi:dienelactone hydrolase